MIANYHTHTFFCDGQAEPVVFVEEAIRQGVGSLGFSAHAPVTFPTDWAIVPSRISQYHNEISRLKNEYAERIDIFCGMEADFFSDIMPSVQALYDGYTWDYIIGAIHFIGADGQLFCIDGPHEHFVEGWRNIMDSDPLFPIQTYFDVTRKMIREMKCDVIGHIDKIKIQSRPDCIIPYTHPFFRKQLMATLEEIASTDCIVEVNTRWIEKEPAKDFFPGRDVFSEMQKMRIPVTVSSDAHKPDEITYGFKLAETALYQAGYKTVMMIKNGKWEEKPLQQ